MPGKGHRPALNLFLGAKELVIFVHDPHIDPNTAFQPQYSRMPQCLAGIARIF